MRIVLFAHGTRGDVAPIVALGWVLTRGGHDVTVAVPEEFRAFVEQTGLRAAPLPLDMMAWLRTPEGQQLLQTGGLTFMRRWAQEYRHHAPELDAAHRAAAEGADVLVGNHITIDRAVALGDALRVPVAIYVPFPLAPSREYAPFTTRGRLRSPTLRMAAHELSIRVWWREVSGPVDAFRAELGLAPSAAPTIRRLMRDPRHLALYALSSSLFPRPSDWPDHIAVTAPWTLPAELRDDLGETLPADLEAWLDAGEPPVFLGFGSMPVLDPRPLLDDIAAVTEGLGLRAIVSENCVPADDELPDHLFAAGTVDHDRLFTRCSAAVHHGGIGTLHASLGAGLPTMVCSILGDQPWWGEHIVRLGIGAHVPFRDLDRDRLRAGLTTLRAPGVAGRAEAFGASIRAEGDGLAAAGRIFEDWLRWPLPPARRQRTPA
ncbi:MAG TPA: glycosyltransferase [Baekduia sp.]|uniref:glycosyltransferase n=1 Tax=Baekduia sp. TaxID=2600305 RepID=UPI002D79D25A|nr:glycosyltransferase [Baekduia sp.]HET6509061.1 glycosyltransferase [Baekduia sp.]